MKKVIYFLSGCLFTAIIMSSFSVFAETASKIDVIFGRVNLIVHGEKIDKETLLYNGTTYLPLRAVAEIFEKEVAWNSTDNTAYIDEEGTNRQTIIDSDNDTGVKKFPPNEALTYPLSTINEDEYGKVEKLVVSKLNAVKNNEHDYYHTEEYGDVYIWCYGQYHNGDYEVRVCPADYPLSVYEYLRVDLGAEKIYDQEGSSLYE